MSVTKEAIEAAARAMCDAWCYAKIGTPDGNAEWARKQDQYRKQSEAAISAALPFLPPIAGEGKVTAIADELTAALDGAFVTTTSGGGQRPYLTVMFPENSQVRRLYDALASFSSLRRNPSSPGKDGGQEVEAVKPLAPVDVYKVLKSWSDHGSLDIDHLSAISREVAALARPQPASMALVEAPSPQSTVDAGAAGRKLSLWFFRDLSGEQRGKLFGLFGMNDAQRDTNHGYQAMALSQVVRALKAKSPSSDRAASEGLSPWAGWDKSSYPWSEAHHKDSVCYAAFGQTWSMEDAHALISFIDRTWGGTEAKGSGQ